MNQLDSGVLERARGALLGQLVGDALGTTVEFEPAAAIARRYPDGLREIVGGGPFRVLPGQITDDSELALALARSLVARRAYDPDHVAASYLRWYSSDPFDVGPTTRQAFGVHDDETPGLASRVSARASKTSQANGSLMRASPLAIFGWSLPGDVLAGHAAADSRLSHAHPVCQAACVVFTHAIAFAVRTGSPPRAVHDEALAFAGRSALAAPIMDALVAAANEPPRDFQSQQGWVRVAFQNAFFELLHGGSFEESLVRTVARGGDTDTNGCIAGALLGAVAGETAIPERWRKVVLACRTDRGPTYQTTDARDLAEALVGGASAATSSP